MFHVKQSVTEKFVCAQYLGRKPHAVMKRVL